jgi:Xaa-Pro aminopeptidase
MRYTTQLEDECPGLKLRVRPPGEKMLDAAVEVISRVKLDKLGVEGASMTVGLFNSLQEKLPKTKLDSTSDLVENLRAIKDKDEVAAIRVACLHAKQAFEAVRASAIPSMTESQVAADLEYQARRFGAKGLSFEPIVGVGARSALPHGRPTHVRLEAADFTLVDWGARTGLYVSDLTRMWVTGKVSPKFRKIYEVVLKAQLAGIGRSAQARSAKRSMRWLAASLQRRVTENSLGTAWVMASDLKSMKPRGSQSSSLSNWCQAWW